MACGRSRAGQWSWLQGWAHAEAVVTTRVQPGKWGQQLWDISLNSHREPFLNNFLLFKPAAPIKHPVSHTAQLSNQIRDCPGSVHHVPTIFPSPGIMQLPNFSGNDSVDIHSLSGWTLSHCVYHFVFIFPSDFKHPGPSWCCSNLVWQRREPLTWLSSKNSVAGCVAALVPMLVPGTLLSQSYLLTVWSFSVLYSFGLQPHKCWDNIGCSVCSSEMS